MSETSTDRRDAIARRLLGTLSLVPLGLFLWIVVDLLVQGLPLLDLDFLVSAPRDAGRAGGIGPILLSTLWIVGVCLLVAVPISLGTALLLAESTSTEGPFATTVRVSLDVLAAVPSIVFGLFGNVFFCKVLGLGFSILSGGLTLACMVLPLLIRSVEQGLRAVPRAQRLGAAALGLGRATTLLRVLLPAATPGLVVGLTLGIGRAMAETAALIFTSGSVDRWPESVHDSGRALSIHVYDLSMNVPGGSQAAYASAVVLLALLLVVNAAAASLARRLLARELVEA